MKIKKITTRKAWSEEDNRAIVGLYNTFLNFQENDIKYQKAAPVRGLSEGLGRSKGSIECKLMNISAIRQERGLSIVKGYKSLSNYNKDLVAIVEEYLR